MKKLITILIPAYNEEDVISLLYERLIIVAKENDRFNFEFLFVNDGSRDRTIEKIKAIEDDRMAYINLSRNYGKEAAMMAGFDYARGDAVVVIDADLQDPPELISEMLRFWEQGFDDVYAKRSNRLGESWLKRFTSKVFYRLLQRLTRIPIQQDTGDFRLLDRKCVEALKSMRETQRYTKGMFSWIGFNKKEIVYIRDARAAGSTKWNYLKLFDLAIEGITSFTTAPLRLSSFIGVLISLAAFIYIALILARTIMFGIDAPGYASMMAVILFLGGVQLMSLGIIGEYVGRIFNETKNRPVYFVEEYNGKKRIDGAKG